MTLKYLNRTSIALLLVFFLLFTVGCSDGSDDEGDGGDPQNGDEAETVELYVMAAASLTESLNEIAELYKDEAPNVTIIPNYDASGKLQTQIEEGAPADIFFSAAPTQMNALEEQSLIISASRKDLLINKVVLITPMDSDLEITSFEDAAEDFVDMVGIGDPESVPVGQYTQEAFETLGLWDQIKAKANLGTDVKQVLTWVETGDVNCGFVYSTDATSSGKVNIVCDAPEGSHSPVIYPAALLEGSGDAEAAQAFLDFLSSDEAKAVFIKYGFSVE